MLKRHNHQMQYDAKLQSIRERELQLRVEDAKQKLANTIREGEIRKRAFELEEETKKLVFELEQERMKLDFEAKIALMKKKYEKY